MGRSSASTRRWPANGLTGSSTARIDSATRRCHTGSSTTTGADHTARWETGLRSAAFTTSVGRTPSRRACRPHFCLTPAVSCSADPRVRGRRMHREPVARLRMLNAPGADYLAWTAFLHARRSLRDWNASSVRVWAPAGASYGTLAVLSRVLVMYGGI